MFREQEVVRSAASRPKYPIYAMTGHVDAEAQEEFMAVGFSGCLGKPFTVDGLRQLLLLQDRSQWVYVTGVSTEY